MSIKGIKDKNGTIHKIEPEGIILTEELKTYYPIGKFKNASGTNPETIGTIGETLADVFDNLFKMDETQPSIISYPTVKFSSISKASSGNVIASNELGAKISYVRMSITLDDGEYTNTSATGSTWSSVTIKEYRDGNEVKSITIEEPSSSALQGYLYELASNYIVSDPKTTITFKVSGEYTDGAVAKTNLGNNSNPEIKIKAGASAEDSKDFSITAEQHTYYAVTNSTDTPTTWTSFGSESVTDIQITASAGQYIWIASASSYSNIYEVNEVSGDYNTDPVATTKTSGNTLENVQGTESTYYYYRTTNARAGSGTSTFKLA